MVWPPGRVNTSDQPLIAVELVLVMVTCSVRPLFQALTSAETRQAPAGDGVVELGDGVVVLGDGVVVLGDGVVVLGDGVVVVVVGGLGELGVDPNCEKKAQTAGTVHDFSPGLRSPE